MKKMYKYLSFIMMLALVFSITSISKVTADTLEINLLDYRDEYDDRDGLVIWVSIPVIGDETYEFTIPNVSYYALESGQISFNNGGGSIDLTSLTATQLEDGYEFNIPIGTTYMNIYYDSSASEQDFYYDVYSGTHLFKEVNDVTPPVINGGIFFADVDNPVTLADIKATLTATDDTDGDISNDLVNTADNYTVNSDTLGDYVTTWEVSDSSGNTTAIDITVRVVDITAPVVTLNGSSTIYVEYLDTYTDPGAMCTDNYDSSCTPDLITNDVNTSALGTYEVSYDATDSSGNVSNDAIRVVYVQDTTVPVIAINGSSTIYVEYLGAYTEQGASWTDNYDGSGAAVVTGTVDTTTLGSYTVNYNYTDTNGNIASTVTRTIVVQDTTDPSITLNGATTIYVEYGDTYSELGASWTDNYDGTGAATISGTVNNEVLGSYTINYNYTDTNGNSAITVTRTVIVQDTTAPVIYAADMNVYNSQNKTITEALAVVIGSDIYDGDVTASIIITTDNYTGNETTVGTYSVTLSLTDSNGNNSTKTINITVLDDIAPQIFVDSYIVTEAEADAMTQAEIIALIQSRSS